MAVGDIRSNARGSGARYNDNKTRLDLIPLASLKPAADVFEYGAAKYAKFNWQKGQQWSVPLECAMRHIAALQRGEMIDPESGQPHVGHLLCNAIMLSHFYMYYPEGDDLTEREQYFTLAE